LAFASGGVAAAAEDINMPELAECEWFAGAKLGSRLRLGKLPAIGGGEDRA
jgi:hypothetical protein